MMRGSHGGKHSGKGNGKGGSNFSGRQRRAPKRAPHKPAAKSQKSGPPKKQKIVEEFKPVKPTEAIRLGFVRGVAPDKWLQRWAMVQNRADITPVPLSYRAKPQTHLSTPAKDCDLVLMRVPEGVRPEGSDGSNATHFAVPLYTEQLAVILPKEHELAKEKFVTTEDLELLNLLDYGTDTAPATAYDGRWPIAQAWADPSFKPKDLRAAFELVAAGLGATLAPLPLARALSSKHDHKVVQVRATPGHDPLPSATVFAVWHRERDRDDIQELIGVLRGRGSRSSR